MRATFLASSPVPGVVRAYESMDMIHSDATAESNGLVIYEDDNCVVIHGV